MGRHRSVQDDELIAGPLDSARLPWYTRVDISVNRQGHLFGLQANPYLSIVNVLNAHNPAAYVYSFDGRPKRGSFPNQNVVTPSAKVVIVHAVLDASASAQTIVVQTTTGAESQQRDVVGAQVTIGAPNGLLRAAQVQDTSPPLAGVRPVISTRYQVSSAQIGAIVPGATYTLHIVLPDGREVNGATVVPSVSLVSTVMPLPDFDYSHDTLSFAWHGSKGTTAFEVYIESSRSSFSIFADTTISVPGRVNDSNGRPAFWPGLTHRVLVSAVDANYYDYYRRTTDAFTGRGLITHLDGAIGVFGSIVPVASYSFVVR